MDTVEQIVSIIESAVFTLSLIAGGFWAYYKFVKHRKNNPIIEGVIELDFIGVQKKEWLVDFYLILNNKGHIRKTINKIEYSIRFIEYGESLQKNNPKGISFTKILEKSEFDLPSSVVSHDQGYIFVDPNSSSMVGKIISIPQRASFIELTAKFSMGKNEDYFLHKMAKVPKNKTT